jgi:hypothetical protein
LKNSLDVLNILKVSDAQIIGEILSPIRGWTAGQSATVQVQKELRPLVPEKIYKGNGYYRTLDCKSEYKDHAKSLTHHLARILKSPYNPTIYREHSFPNGLRADAVCLVRKGNKALCFVLEVVINEPHSYLEMKRSEWKRWKGAKDYLTQLFKVEIPHFAIVVEGREISWAVPLSKILEDV